MEERMLQPDGNGAAVAELESLRSRIDAWLVKDEGSGRFQIDREAFTDADVFALELKYIFERNWVFIAHERQVAKPNDFLTTFIGRQPVILTRHRPGQLPCLTNACAHPAARACRAKSGTRPHLPCPFHGRTSNPHGPHPP